MRRLHGGLLAAALLLVPGCGSGGSSATAEPEPATIPIRTPTLAASSQVTAAAKPDGSTFTALVTSPDGVSSPGLDAAVSVLIERPELDVVVVAPSAGAPTGLIADGHTMTGFPAHIVGAAMADAVPVAIEELGLEVDLVVVGLVDGAVLGGGIESSSVAVAVRNISRHGLPALVVTVGTEHGPDLAAAGLMMRSLLDIDLDALLEPGARFLAVPSCNGGLVRGPLTVTASSHESVAASVDCRNVERSDPQDDVEAHSRGFATLVEQGVGGQAIP